MSLTFREATDALAVPLETIAAVVGRSYPTILAYRQDQRQPTAEVWRALAKFAREHVADVRDIARELAAVAKEAEREERQRQ